MSCFDTLFYIFIKINLVKIVVCSCVSVAKMLFICQSEHHFVFAHAVLIVYFSLKY